MFFDILNLIENPNKRVQALDLEEHNSFYLGTCPVCKSRKLKINKNTGTFSCYANNCNQGKIFKKIESPAYKRSVNRDGYKKPKWIGIKNAIDVEFDLDLSKFVGGKLPITQYYFGENKVTEFRYLNTYLDDCKLVRIDTPSKEKFFSFRYKKDGQVIKDKHTDFGLYGYQEDTTLPCIFSEGEKACTASLFWGYSSLCLPTFATYDISWIKRHIQKYSKGFYYVADHDEVGYTKALLFAQCCWAENIPCTVVDLAVTLSNAKSGFDMYDLIQQRIIKREELLTFLHTSQIKIGSTDANWS